MKKIAIFTLLLLAISFSGYATTDWNEFESGRNNIRLDGYQGQPGYISFTDGDGKVLGYLFASPRDSDGVVTLYFLSPGDIDLNDTKLGSQGGEGQLKNR